MFENWKVLYLKTRTEKKLASICDVRHVEYYLPLKCSTRVYQRRKVTFHTPIFPGYFFVNMTNEVKKELLKYGLIVSVIPVSQPVRMLRQLVAVRSMLRADPSLDTVEPVTEGDVVRVAVGAFRGFEGTITKVKRKPGVVKLTMNIEIVGRAVCVETDMSMLERVYDPKMKKNRHI